MKLINILSFITTCLVIIQITLFGLNLGNIYYVLLLVAFLILFFKGVQLKFSFPMIIFLAAGFLSIYLNVIPEFFKPYERFVAFIIVVGLIGPLIYNSAFHDFRLILGNMLNNAILIMVTLSFVGIVAGFPMMIGRGGFVGFFNHSMMLGPMAAIAILVALHKAQISKNKKKYWFFMSLSAIAFITCVAAGSRSAIISGIAGSLFFYYKLNQGKITRFVKIILIIATLGIFSFPIWEPYTERVMEKLAYSEDKGDALATRSELWEMRVKEFQSSSIIGVGFASVDTQTSTKFNKEDGKVEPGSSWLALLSMTGLFGFIPIFIIVAQNIVYLFKNREYQTSLALVGGMFFLFIIHMMAEGYVLSAGSGMFFYFWLTMGKIDVFKRSSEIKPNQQ